MERLLLLVDKLRKFFNPMFEADLVRVEVKILDMIIIGVDHLFKQSSTVERNLFMIFIE
jgi:hypothetical protein